MAGGFLLEIRRGTQRALLVVRQAELPSAPMDVWVEAERLEARSGGTCLAAAALPAGLTLAPPSCRGASHLPGDGLHLRLRLRRAPPPTDVVFNLRESLKPQKNYIFYCQSCGDIIVKDRKFFRVLPLPSEHWSALVEEWCCHPDPFARSTLHPQNDDCFLGDTFFLLNSGNESHVPESRMCCSETGHDVSQNCSHLKSKENTRVICKRCKTMLGEAVSPDTIKYYVTEVIIQPSEGSFSPTPRSQFIQSVVAQCLVELSSAKSTFRFTVKGDNGKIYILIWLLNCDTLLVESLGSSSSHSVSTLFGDSFMPSSAPVGTWNAVKVLYQPCTKSRNNEAILNALVSSLQFFFTCTTTEFNTIVRAPIHQGFLITSSEKLFSEVALKAFTFTDGPYRAVCSLADAWENDIGVHPLTFPSETCLELLLILGLSTTSLPPSLRCLNSFQVLADFSFGYKHKFRDESKNKLELLLLGHQQVAFLKM